MPTQRAFTYLKIRGGDLDRIREILLLLPEVREMHLLTGDWDVFVVLEFHPSRAKKRQVLDFVTERIRGIPEVLDTSTLVPEYSVTKFPF
jgi:DNA-binding Lrp family transcriptional regulator